MTKRTNHTNNPNPHAMVTMETKLFRPSITEMVQFSAALLILLNSIVLLLFTLLFGKSYPEVFSKTWIILIFTPLLTGIVQPLSNRAGLLTMSGLADPLTMQAKLAELLKYFDYQETGRDDQSVYLDYRTNWKRSMHFNKGQVSITVEQDSVMISGKKIVLDFIETKMLLGKDFKALNVQKIKGK
jgi:hypothetical protein